MSIAQYNRGTAKLRRDTDNQQAAHREAKDRRPTLARELDTANQKIARMEQELKAAQDALETAQAEIVELTTRCTTAEAEATANGAKAESFRHSYMVVRRVLKESREGRNQLARIMRLALTPERYHYYRELSEDYFPSDKQGSETAAENE